MSRGVNVSSNSSVESYSTSSHVTQDDEATPQETVVSAEAVELVTLPLKQDYFDHVKLNFSWVVPKKLAPEQVQISIHHYPKNGPRNADSDSCLRLFVHGWQTAGSIFDPIAKASQKSPDYTCNNVTIDLPGFGQSPALDTIAYENPLAYTMILKAVVDYLKGKYKEEKVALVGHSMGGGISLLYGLLNPQDVFDLDLISPYTGKIPLGNMVEKHPKIVTKMKPGIYKLSMWLASSTAARKAFREYSDEIWPGLMFAWNKDKQPKPEGEISYSEVRLRTATMDWRYLRALLERYPEYAQTLLNEASVSIAYGNHDNVIPPKQTKRDAKLLGVEATKFKGRHHTFLGHPQKAIDFITEKSGDPGHKDK